jgi:TonB-dependent starch-binding outer membrane protein SusC
MKRYLIAGLVIAWGGASPLLAQTATPVPAPAPSTSMRTTESARERSRSLAQLLQGRLSGVTVSAAPDGGIVVRMGGPTSFYGNQSPLFVIDGVETESNGTLSWLSPADVESIQALKDPSQTAIYGIRGANGVILIRTKGSH